MEQLFELLRPTLPSWMVAPAIIVLLFLFLWPTLRDIWMEVIPSHRTYTSEKRRLELLKLHLEVQALIKQHQLEGLATLAPPQTTPATLPDNVKVLPSRARFLFGGLGGLIAWIISLVFDFPLSEHYSFALLVGFAVSGLVFFFVGGLAAFTMKARSHTDALLYGTIATLIFQVAISTTIPKSTKLGQA
jgi:hypothetical protein